MKKILSVFGIAAALAVNAADAPKKAPAALPLNWKAADAKMSTDAAKIITLKTEKMLGSIQCTLKIPKNRRVRATAEMKGTCKAMLAFNGCTGWNHIRVNLTDKWQTVKGEYGETKGVLTFGIFSMTNAPAEIQVRNLKVELIDKGDMSDEEIGAVGFKAVDRPGPNAKVTKAGSFGKQWYLIVKMPVPANSRPVFYYIHAKADGAIKDMYWLSEGQRTNVPNSLSAEKANGQWAWIKTGPYNTALLAESILLSFTGNSKAGLTVDKVVLSTKGDLTDKQLNGVQVQ